MTEALLQHDLSTFDRTVLLQTDFGVITDRITNSLCAYSSGSSFNPNSCSVRDVYEAKANTDEERALESDSNEGTAI